MSLRSEEYDSILGGLERIMCVCGIALVVTIGSCTVGYIEEVNANTENHKEDENQNIGAYAVLGYGDRTYAVETSSYLEMVKGAEAKDSIALMDISGNCVVVKPSNLVELGYFETLEEAKQYMDEIEVQSKQVPVENKQEGNSLIKN